MAVLPFDQHPFLSQLFNDPDVIECLKTKNNDDCFHNEVMLDGYIAKIDAILAVKDDIDYTYLRYDAVGLPLILNLMKSIYETQKCFLAENCGMLDGYLIVFDKFIDNLTGFLKGLVIVP